MRKNQRKLLIKKRRKLLVKRPESDAGQLLVNPRTSPQVKRVAASLLARIPRKNK